MIHIWYRYTGAQADGKLKEMGEWTTCDTVPGCHFNQYSLLHPNAKVPHDMLMLFKLYSTSKCWYFLCVYVWPGEWGSRIEDLPLGHWLHFPTFQQSSDNLEGSCTNFRTRAYLNLVWICSDLETASFCPGNKDRIGLFGTEQGELQSIRKMCHFC